MRIGVVKEPGPAEYDRLREETVLFTYLHLAADRVEEALNLDPGFRQGLNTQAGSITHDAVAAAFG